MKPADMLEVFKRLAEKEVPFLREHGHKPIEPEDVPLFLQSVPNGIES